jgi:hypothetical protein
VRRSAGTGACAAVCGGLSSPERRSAGTGDCTTVCGRSGSSVRRSAGAGVRAVLCGRLPVSCCESFVALFVPEALRCCGPAAEFLYDSVAQVAPPCGSWFGVFSVYLASCASCCCCSCLRALRRGSEIAFFLRLFLRLGDVWTSVCAVDSSVFCSVCGAQFPCGLCTFRLFAVSCTPSRELFRCAGCLMLGYLVAFAFVGKVLLL